VAGIDALKAVWHRGAVDAAKHVKGDAVLRNVCVAGYNRLRTDDQWRFRHVRSKAPIDAFGVRRFDRNFVARIRVTYDADAGVGREHAP